MNTSLRLLRRLLPAAGLLGAFGGVDALSSIANAGPAEVIYTPIVEYREWEIELKGGVQDWGDRDKGERAFKPTLGYGIAPRWFAEIELEYSQAPGRASRLEEYEFENIFQLTEHGEHWLDAGIFAELDHNRLANVNTLVLGPMLQRETTHTQTNLNIFYQRSLSALPKDADASRSAIAYQAQWKWNLHPRFQPGLQAFGSLGDPTHLHSDELKIGPAFFGSAKLGSGRNLKYNAALLAGMTRNTPDTTFRFQLEYEFR